MAEYITKKQVIEWFSCYGHDDKQIRFDDLSFDIQNMIPEDVVPVVHGKWKYFQKKNIAVCTNCSFERNLDDNFGRAVSCPNCGAKMDGGNYG